MTVATDAERYEAVRRLLHIETSESGVSVADLIAFAFAEMALLFLSADAPHSLDQIQKTVGDLFGLLFEKGELGTALRLVGRQQQDRVVRVGRRADRYTLTEARRAALERQVGEFDELEKRVFGAWCARLQREYPNLEEGDLSGLLEDQQLFNRHVLLQHGAQTQSILCGTKVEPDSRVQTTLSIEAVLESLPDRSHHIVDVRREALVAFWSEPDVDRQRYLATLLDNACVIHTAHIDPRCSALVRGVFRDTLFYLDTNVLYRLLNLQGAGQFFQIHMVIEVIRAIGGRPLISQQTLAELRRSLTYNEQRIRLHPIASVALAQLAAAYSGRIRPLIPIESGH